jgi:hypothetical protein
MKGETPGSNIEHRILATEFSLTFHLHVKTENINIIQHRFKPTLIIYYTSKAPSLILNRFWTVLGSILKC